jgi:hypothetical protein
MSKINEMAKGYQTKATKNIADLAEVPVDLEVLDDEFEVTDQVTKQVKVVKQKVVNLNGINYRVPNSVFQQLKVLLEDNPNLKRFKVKASGSGMETRYQVIPLF